MLSDNDIHPPIYGIAFEQWDHDMMLRILSAFRRVPEIPFTRENVFLALTILSSELSEDENARIQGWVQKGGPFPAGLGRTRPERSFLAASGGEERGSMLRMDRPNSIRPPYRDLLTPRLENGPRRSPPPELPLPFEGAYRIVLDAATMGDNDPVGFVGFDARIGAPPYDDEDRPGQMFFNYITDEDGNVHEGVAYTFSPPEETPIDPNKKICPVCRDTISRDLCQTERFSGCRPHPELSCLACVTNHINIVVLRGVHRVQCIFCRATLTSDEIKSYVSSKTFTK